MLLTEYIEYHAQVRPDSPILLQNEQTVSFARAVTKSQNIAAWLQQQGIGYQDRIAILSENSIDHILLLLAASYIGAVFVPLNYRLAAAEIADVLEDAETKLLLTNDSALSSLTNDLTPLLSDQIIVTESLNEVNSESGFETRNESDTVIQLYTSGTTGKPKGVQIDHVNIESLAIPSWMSYRSKVGIGTTDLVVAPLFHIGGLGSVLVPIMAGGAVLLHRQFEPGKIVDDIEQHGVNTLFMVPAMIQAVLTTVPNIRERDFSSLKLMAYGASPITPSLLIEAIEVFSCDFQQLYGMTETAGAVVALSAEDHERAIDSQPELLKSCGRGMTGVKVKICDANGNRVANGETGEIVIHSRTNTSGYWKRPEETAKSIKDSWVYTGDAGTMDGEGFIYIRDRIKDMVVTGGENVYPVEVEKVIAGHPAILETAVIGVPDEKFGEALMAICALRPNSELNAEDLIEFCRDKIAGYKIPRLLSIVDALPRNPSGKILKTILREPYWSDQERQV